MIMAACCLGFEEHHQQGDYHAAGGGYYRAGKMSPRGSVTRIEGEEGPGGSSQATCVEAGGGLRFESRFESGNLLMAIKVPHTHRGREGLLSGTILQGEGGVVGV